MLYFTNNGYFLFKLMKKKGKKERKYTPKLEMVFQHRMHEFLLEKQFMQ